MLYHHTTVISLARGGRHAKAIWLRSDRLGIIEDLKQKIQHLKARQNCLSSRLEVFLDKIQLLGKIERINCHSTPIIHEKKESHKMSSFKTHLLQICFDIARKERSHLTTTRNHNRDVRPESVPNSRTTLHVRTWKPSETPQNNLPLRGHGQCTSSACFDHICLLTYWRSERARLPAFLR